MNSASYLPLSISAICRILCVAIALSCYPSGLPAKERKLVKPKIETPQPAELVLSLPERWLQPTDSSDSADQRLADYVNGIDAPDGAGKKSEPVKVGCGLDVSEYTLANPTLGNRLEGNCKFNYHY